MWTRINSIFCKNCPRVELLIWVTVMKLDSLTTIAKEIKKNVLLGNNIAHAQYSLSYIIYFPCKLGFYIYIYLLN